MNQSRAVRTQFLIFTLFGDYVVYRDGKIWTGSLLRLMRLLGVSERAVRSTLSRMSQKGWLSAKKYGRRSQYTLTRRGYDLLEEGRRRIFEPIITDWNDQWHLVTYSLPEDKRRRRHALRTKLGWEGFGRLAPGTWISPHDRRVELISTFAELDVDSYVNLFCGVYLGPSSAKEMMDRCWDLDGLESQYREFIDQYEMLYSKHLEQINEQPGLSQQDCFIHRFWLTHDFQSFPLRDPNLPTTLLSPEWRGFAARELFENYRQLLGVKAEEYVSAVMSGDGPAPDS